MPKDNNRINSKRKSLYDIYSKRIKELKWLGKKIIKFT
jgi:hypothetical protein